MSELSSFLGEIIYFVGIFCFLAAKDPLKHQSFLWFVVWSSIFHGTVMLFHALYSETHRWHLLGDVSILFGACGLAVPLWQASTSSIFA